MSFAASRHLALLIAMLLPHVAQAIPRFALRMGASCQTCHVDPTGAGMRNAYGSGIYQQSNLAMNTAPVVEPRLSNSVALGSDLRMLFQHLSRTGSDVPRLDSFYQMESSLYLAANLGPRATLYLAPSFFGSESVLFEAAAIFKLGWQGAYVKAGRFVPPFGYKLPNHQVFIRKLMGFNARTKEVGVEVGVEPGPVSWQVAVFNGLPEGQGSDWDENREKGISTRLSYRLKARPMKLELGLSGWHNTAGNGPDLNPTGEDTRVEEIKVGAFGGLAVGRLAWLGEIDLVSRDDRQAPKVLKQVASYQELGFLMIRGVELVASYELWDQDAEISGDAAHRFGGRLELFPWPFVELNVGYWYTKADPRHAMAQLHEALGLVHVFF